MECQGVLLHSAGDTTRPCGADHAVLRMLPAHRLLRNRKAELAIELLRMLPAPRLLRSRKAEFAFESPLFHLPVAPKHKSRDIGYAVIPKGNGQVLPLSEKVRTV